MISGIVKKILILIIVVIFFSPQYLFGLTNEICAISCNPYDPITNPQSCGNASLSCSSSKYLETVDMGNGWCYDRYTCSSFTGTGTVYSGGYTTNNISCTCEFNGPSCQLTTTFGGTVSGPTYLCGGGGGGSGSTDYSISVSPSTRSVVNNENTQFTTTITPVNAMDGETVTLSLTGCPSGATCSFVGGNTITLGTPASIVTKTVSVIPTTVMPATYTISIAAVANSVVRTSTANLIINSGINNAECLAISTQVGGVNTTSFTPGQQFTMSARLRNTGTKTWDDVYTSASDQEHFLGAWNPSGDPWGPGSGRTRLPGGLPVAPGQEVTFTRTLTAPTTPGNFEFQFAIVEEQVQWISGVGAVCYIPGGITVTNTSMPNLTAGNPTQSEAVTGTPLQFSALISNIGTASTGVSFPNFFQIATASDGTGAIDLAPTTMSALGAGTNATASSASHNFTTAGTYYVRACANKSDRNTIGPVTESDANNNCSDWRPVTVSNPVVTGTSRIIGKVCKDDNGDGTCTGEIHIRDVSLGGCTNASSPQSGFSISYTGPQSGSGERLDVCGGVGDPIYSIDNLPAGAYSVSLNIPVGWEFTNGCRSSASGVFVNCPSPSVGNVNVAVGGLESVLFSVRAVPIDQFILTVNKPIGGSIRTVTGSPATPDGRISCGINCTEAYDQGTTVRLEAVPDNSYWVFVGWGGACAGQGAGICQITINGNATVTAQFRPKALLYQEF